MSRFPSTLGARRLAAFLSMLTILDVSQARAAGDAARGPTREEALTRPPQELARRLLGASGSLVKEVQRPVADNPGPLSQLRFAGPPRSAGFPGLCEADTFLVALKPAPVANGSPPNATVVADLVAGKLFKIVGDPARRAGSRDWRLLERRCAASGPVLSSLAPGAPREGFFGGNFNSHRLEAADAHFAARALDQAIKTASPAPVCKEDPAEPAAGFCVKPRAVLERLGPDQVKHVDVRTCPDVPATKCVEVTFDRGSARGTNEARHLAVSIATDAGVIDPPPAGTTIRRIEISASTVAED